MERGIFKLSWMAALASAILLMGTTPATAQDAATEPAPADASAPGEAAAPTDAAAPADPAAPDPADAAAQASSTTAADPAAASAEPAAEEEEEEERTRRFYFEVSGGYTWIGLAQIREDNLIPEPETLKTEGWAVGSGFGFFWHALTLGAQAEISFHDFFNLGTLAFDIGFRIPTPHIEPYFRVGFGYAWMWDIDTQGLMFPATTTGLPTIRGIVFDIGLGFDFMITDLLAVGVGVDGAGFSLRRKADSLGSSLPGIDETEPGDALGYQISALVQLSLHF